MTKNLLLVTALCSLSLVAASAYADPIIIYNASPAWQQVGPDPTWVLPATIPGCGSENEPTCEPTGIFFGNVAWGGVPSYVTLSDSDGVSDIITFDSFGPGGVLQIQFFSDPSSLTVPPGYLLSGSFTEDSNGATTGPLEFITNVFVNLASDGESPFDPFQFGADTSDGIQFTGDVVSGGTIPEPATLALLGAGLAGIGFTRRRKAA